MAKKYNWRKYYNRRKKQLKAEKNGSISAKTAKSQGVKEENMTPAQKYYYKRKAKLEAEANKGTKMAKTTSSAKKGVKKLEKTPKIKDSTPIKIVEVKRAGGIATIYYGASGAPMFSEWVRRR